MSNLQAREALERAKRVFLDKPSAARKPNAMATAVWRDGLRCEVAGLGGERVVTDMPEPMGGKGAGSNPGWLLRASMASCAATAIAMRAAMLGIELRSLEVTVESESDARGLVGIAGIPTALDGIRMTIKIGADGVPEPQLRELAAWGEARSVASRVLNRPSDQQLPFSLRMTRDQGADACRFVCGFLGCDARPFNPLLSALPRVIHAPISSASRGWLSSLLHVAVQESGLDSTGREAMLAKLAELMFVEVIRNHIRGLPEDARGWFAGLRDPHVSAALRLIHGRPSEPWTLEGLARESGLSRSAFAERFVSYVEVSPMQYLGRWRFQIAARLLEDKRMSVAQVAAEVGYQSEAAFNRAFKKYIGTAPGSWRRERMDRATLEEQ